MFFERLLTQARERGGGRLAVVGAGEPNVLAAALRAADAGVAEPVLLGDREVIERTAQELGADLGDHPVEHLPDDAALVARAMELVRDGAVHALLKGRVPTAILMREGLRGGLRAGDRLLTHVSIYDGKQVPRPVMLTDAALVPFPTFEQSIQIVRNGVEAMRAVGVAEPRVAVLSASEEVDEKIPCSVRAARLAAENRPGGALDGWGIVEGPLDLGAAIDPEAARVKGIAGEVPGRADILIPPDVVAGNLLGKAVIYYAAGRVGGCVMGGTAPIALVSRASRAEDKFYSILLALACSDYSGGDQP